MATAFEYGTIGFLAAAAIIGLAMSLSPVRNHLVDEGEEQSVQKTKEIWQEEPTPVLTLTIEDLGLTIRTSKLADLVCGKNPKSNNLTITRRVSDGEPVMLITC